MKIKRKIHDEEVEIELTEDELFEAYTAYEHHCDYEYVKNMLNSGVMEEELRDLTDKQWENACHQIAYEKRRQQDKYLYNESDALDKARTWFLTTVLPTWPKKRYFMIRLANADDNNVLNVVATIYGWAFEKPDKETAAEFAAHTADRAFEEVFDITEIPAEEIDEWFDNPADVPAMNKEV